MNKCNKNKNKLSAASACLAGFPCRWNGKAKTNIKIMKLYKEGIIIPVCPELLAGLDTPRNPCEIKNGRIIDNNENDCTSSYFKGAKVALDIIKSLDIKKVYLKSGSPSCGAGTIYDGSFKGIKMPGYGVFAKLLIEDGIEVIEVK